MPYRLYHTEFCHLCEMAWTLIVQAGLAPDCEQVDIAGDEALEATYGIRIPVLRDPAGRELGWPFDLQRLQEWLAHGAD